MNGAGDQLVLGQVPEPVTLTRLEDDARRSDELGHHDSLGAVDDEGPLLGHHREVPHEDCLLLDLAGVGVHEAGSYKDRGGEGHVLLLALLHRELGRRAKVLVLGIEFQLKRKRLTEVRDRTEVRERVGNPVPTEPLEGLPLDVNQVWQRENFLQIAERITVPNEGESRHLKLLAESHERGRAGNATGDVSKTTRTTGATTATGNTSARAANSATLRAAQPDPLGADPGQTVRDPFPVVKHRHRTAMRDLASGKPIVYEPQPRSAFG